MNRVARPLPGSVVALGVIVMACRADPEHRPQAAPSAPAPPVSVSAASPPPPSAADELPPPQDLPAARRLARGLFAKAMLEPDRKKARAGFLEAAAALPPGGPALYQAGRAAARAGDADEARRLFDRALEALQRATHHRPRLAPMRLFGRIEGLAAGASGRLVLVSAEGGVVVRDAFGWHPRFDHDIAPTAAALAADGTQVVLAAGKRVLSCSLVEARCIAAEARVPLVGFSLSADGETLAARAEDGSVEVRDVASLAVRTTFRSPAGKATALAISSAGDRLFVGLDTGAVLRVRADTGELEGTRRGHTSKVVALAVDASARTLVSADARRVRAGAPSDAEGEVLLQVTDDDYATVQGVVFGPDGTTLFIEREQRLDIWSLAKKEQSSTDLSAATGAPHVAAAPGRLYVGTNMMSVARWLSFTSQIDTYELKDPVQLNQDKALPGGPSWPAAAVPQIQILAAGATLAILDDLCATAVWDVARGAFLRSARAHSTVFRNCPGERLSADGKTLFARADNTTMVAIDVATWAITPIDAGGEVLDTKLPPGAPKGAVSAVESAGTLAWVNAAGSVHVGPREGPFRVLGKRYRRPESDTGHSDPVRDPAPEVALSPKGALLAFRAGPDRAEIWKTAGESPAQVVSRPGISGVAFGAEETAFVSALDGSVTMVREGAAQTLLTPDGAPVFGLVPLRDGRFIAGGAVAADATIHVWSAQDGALRATLTAMPTGAVATTPDGSAELFGSVEGELDCRVGPFVFGLDLCRERLVKTGVLARALEGERAGP